MTTAMIIMLRLAFLIALFAPATAVLLLVSCSAANSAEIECAPNGTCWPMQYERTKQPRIMLVDDPRKPCTRALKAGGWGKYLKGKTVIACTIGMDLPQPIIILPRYLPDWAIAAGWTDEMVERYEIANAHGVAVYKGKK